MDSLLSYGSITFCMIFRLLISLLVWPIPWIVPTYTAGTIVRDREIGTLDLLRATLLTERSIVLGKLGGCLVRLWPAILLLTLLTPLQIFLESGTGFGLFPLFGFALVGAVKLRPELFLAYAANMIGPWSDVVLNGMIGLSASTQHRSSASAVAVAYASVLMAQLGVRLAGGVVVPLLLVLLALNGQMNQDNSVGMILMAPGLVPLLVVSIKVVMAAVLMVGAIWRLKRV
jgi:hypothetical protein